MFSPWKEGKGKQEKNRSAPHDDDALCLSRWSFIQFIFFFRSFPSTQRACRNEKWGWLWFFMDFNWPYRNDADINISFNDVFALKDIISSFIVACVTNKLRFHAVIEFVYGEIHSSQVLLKTSSPKSLSHDTTNNWWWRKMSFPTATATRHKSQFPF